MKHLLFICSRNEWRSRTAETIFQSTEGIVVSSAGTSPSARRRVAKSMIDRADLIFVMETHHLEKLRHRFGRGDWEARSVVLDIRDEYPYMDEELVAELRAVVVEYL